MSDIIDLDVLVPDDKKVLLSGATYVVPGDMPMETYLKVAKASSQQDEGVNEGQILEGMVDALVDLFAYRLPETDTEKRDKIRADLRKLGIGTITQILGKVYGDDLEPEGDKEDGAVPPPPDGDGSTTTS